MNEDNLKTSATIAVEGYLQAAHILQQAIIFVSEKGDLIGANRIFQQEFGYGTASDLKKMTILEVAPHYSLIKWKTLWNQLLEKRQHTSRTDLLSHEEILVPVEVSWVMLDAGNEKICVAIVENLIEKNRYRDLMQLTTEVAKIGGWEWDLAKHLVLLTGESCRILGIGKGEQTINEEDFENILNSYLFPEDRKRLKQILAKAVKRGKNFSEELVGQPTQGASGRFLIHGRPEQSEGVTYKICGAIQDISTITSRHESMYLTQFSVDQAAEMIIWVNDEGHFLYANQAFCQEVDYSQEEVLNMNILDFGVADTMEKRKEIRKELVEKGKMELESVFIRRDGSSFPVMCSLNHIVYQGQNIDCAFCKNITKKKRREKELKLAKFSLDSAPDMVFWVNADGTFVYCNQAVYQQLGYSEKDIQELHLYDLNPNLNADTYAQTWQHFKEQKVVQTETHIKCKDGRFIPVEVKANYIRFEDQELSCSVVRDITERKKREKEIEEMSKQLESDNLLLREEIELIHNFDSIISQSKKYRPVLKQIEQVAPTQSTVLITGETGTGKELIARSIHQLSSRSNRPMVKVNCAALPANLIESELFGHERGAFTGAIAQKNGRFEVADGGTIFLDEIGEVPLDLQVKLLRVIQESEFERVGGTSTIKVDVRIIAATNRNLENMVAEGSFREDLYYRLNVFPIYNLSLRERKDDIPLLIRYFTGKYAEKAGKNITKIPEVEIERLMRYDFPGNIRELENIIERAVILSKGELLNLLTAFRPHQTSNKDQPTYFKTFEEMQKAYILEALKKTDGKVSGAGGAAELLGLNDRTLTSKIKRFNINKEDIYN
ncbi:MAG: hypothetical protein DHS20C18_24260 [Saprospiraceae bacterium]|nr:MAG: hypothetical protein DHS20C18_24260 [Saprospiraceae bacterium]